MPRRRAAPAPPTLPPALRVCDAVGHLIEFWGFSRHMGRVWALLYLSPQPLPAPEICRALALSAGAVSGVLRDLQRWGVVTRVWVPGQRKDHFEAETDLWKMLSRVFQERERMLLRDTRRALDRALDDVAAARPRGAAAQRRRAFERERIERLRGLCRTAETLLEALLETRRLDVRGLEADLLAR